MLHDVISMDAVCQTVKVNKVAGIKQDFSLKISWITASNKNLALLNLFFYLGS